MRLSITCVVEAWTRCLHFLVGDNEVNESLLFGFCEILSRTQRFLTRLRIVGVVPCWRRCDILFQSEAFGHTYLLSVAWRFRLVLIKADSHVFVAWGFLSHKLRIRQWSTQSIKTTHEPNKYRSQGVLTSYRYCLGASVVWGYTQQVMG